MKRIITDHQELFRKCTLVLLTVFLALAQGSFLYAQESTRVITGKVTDSESMPIPGVNIFIKGTSAGTITDANGMYTLNAVSGNAVLVYSFVGYTTQEKEVGSQTELNITLADNANELSEVVVTALGIEKDIHKVGFASQNVQGSDLTKAREPNAINSLVGKVAGLSIGSSPELLGRPNIVLRGNSDVLFVVNGVPVNSDSWNLSADDIETYTVLKGANAAALYGSRGQNGAIIITTRKGSKSKNATQDWAVDFNSSTMVESGYLAIPKIQGEYGRGDKFVDDEFGPTGLYSAGPGTNNRRYNVWGPRFEGQQIRQYDSPLTQVDALTYSRGTSPWVSRGVNNMKNFLQPGVLSTNNIAISKAGEHYDLRVSASHTYQKGMGPNTKLNVENLNVSAGFDLTERLRLETNVNLNVQHTPNIPDQSYGPNSYVYLFGVYGSADYDVRDLKDYYKGPMGVQDLMQYSFEYGRDNNPYFMANKWLRGHNKTDVYGSAKLTYKVSKALDVSLRTQVTTWNQLRTEKVPAGANLNAYTPWFTFGWYGDYRSDQRNLMENNSDLLITYNKQISNWSLSALAGASSRIFKYESSYATTKSLSIPGVYDFANSKSPVLSYNFGSNMQVYSGYYSIDLGYKKFFNLSHTGRVDNLSTLPKGSNSFYYPSVSLTSVITDYVELPRVISFLKLRGSYADVKGGLTQAQSPTAYKWVTGNNTGDGTLLGYGSELYSSYDGPSYTNQSQFSNASYYNGTQSVSFPTTLSNPSLKPFNIVTYEAGLDVRFLQNRIGLDVTYFTTQNGPAIYPLTVPSSTGYNYHNVNAVTTRKKGWEISLKGTPVKTSSGFSWDILANWSTFKETLESIGGGLTELPQNGHNYKVGERLDAYYSTGYVRDAQNNIVYNSAGGPLSSPGGINNNVFLGNLNPDFSYGINNKFSYKALSLSFQFDGRVGGKIYDRIWYQQQNAGSSVESASGAMGEARLKEWQSTENGTKPVVPAYVGDGVVITSGTPVFANGQISNLSELTFAPNTTAITVQGYSNSSLGSNFNEAYMISRTFSKLREVVLSYKVPVTVFGKSQTLIKGATISLIGRNLLYFAARKDFDIDQYASGYNASTRTLTGSNPDLSSPTTRRYGININLTF